MVVLTTAGSTNVTILDAGNQLFRVFHSNQTPINYDFFVVPLEIRTSLQVQAGTVGQTAELTFWGFEEG